VDLSVLRAGQMWFIDQIESAHRLRAVSAVGERFRLHDTANGKAALALLGAAEVDDLLAHVAADRGRHHAELARPARPSPSTATSTPRISAAGVAGRRPAATSSPSRYRLPPTVSRPTRSASWPHCARRSPRRPGWADRACQRLRGGTQWLT
jgi:hypothetical protein